MFSFLGLNMLYCVQQAPDACWHATHQYSSGMLCSLLDFKFNWWLSPVQQAESAN